MTIIVESLTVKQLAEMAEQDPSMPQYPRLALCKTYETFIEIVNDMLDGVLCGFQENANRLQGHSEDAFNYQICQVLKQAGLDAQHDTNFRGHSDITIKFGKYTFICEGKIVRSVNNSYLLKGYKQLSTRYVTGTTNSWACALLIYCFAPKATRILNEWQKYLKRKDSSTPNFASNITTCFKEPNFSFVNFHEHVSSGETIWIRNRICSLNFTPEK